MGGSLSRTPLVFVGEAPSPSTAWRAGAAPLVGETGRRLAAWAGLTPAAFRARSVCVNLMGELPERWSQRAARAAATQLWAALMDARAEQVVLLGQRVARAFGMTHQPLFEGAVTAGPAVIVMPHPSGLNRYWNDLEHVRQAEGLLRRLLATEWTEPRQGRLDITGEART